MTSNFCAGFALKLDEESAIFKSQYAENYTVAWAPDCSFLAWSQGGGIVYLLPWDRQCAKMCVASEYSISSPYFGFISFLIFTYNQHYQALL